MYPRFVERRIREALADTRVVLICGPRQSGKTTLAQHVAEPHRPFVTLDDATTLRAATADPVGFLRVFDKAVIDEVQRAPDLILAIKATVDEDPRPGRFLLTGSANLMTLPRVADSLAGRMSIIRLFPLAQAELRATPSTLLDHLFMGKLSHVASPAVGDDLLEIVLAGGYPEALARPTWRRRRDWHLDYIEAIIQRDIRDIARVDQLSLMPRLLRALAEQSGQLVNHSHCGAPLGMNHVTTRRYTDVFENLFLVNELPAWHTNLLKRLTKSPKLHFVDAGLLASLRNLSPDRLRRDRTLFGPLLETFVLTELMKMAAWSGTRYTFSHFRDKDRNEVDIVIEDDEGKIVGVEVKASATASSADFSGMRRLAAACGDRFALGLVLYDHSQTVPFGDRFIAAPIATLW